MAKKVLVQQSDLLRALAFAVPFAEKSSSIPILSNVLIRASNKQLTLTTTDLDVSVVAPVKATVQDDFVCTVPAARILGYVKLLPDTELTIEPRSNNWLTVTHGRGNAKLAGMSPESFPEIPESPGDQIDLPLKDIVAAIRQVGISVSHEEAKHTLPASLLELSLEGAAMVGTDGHRLSISRLPLPGSSDMRPVILSVSAMRAVASVASASGSELISFGIEGRDHADNYFFDVDGYRIVARAVAGNFPPYKKALPASFFGQFTVDRLALAATLKRVVSMSEERSRGIRLSISRDITGAFLSAVSSNDKTETDDRLMIDYDGRDWESGFNGGYLLDYLEISTADKVTVKLGSKLGATEIGDAGTENSRYLVMPMRV